MNSVRRERIRELLQAKPFVSLRELERLFPELSSMTLRRDIEYFEKQGEAIKVRGGARSMRFITHSTEEAFTLRMGANVYAKELIAREAVKRIETGRSIFFDAGTTMLQLASMIPDEHVTITTTGPIIALELLKKSQPIVNIVGGMLNRGGVSVFGNLSTKFLGDINIDLAFIVPAGISAENGLTCGNYAECELKRMVVEKARRVVVLMDSSKLGRSMPYTFCRFDQIDEIIVDTPLPEELAVQATDAHVQITVAERPKGNPICEDSQKISVQ